MNETMLHGGDWTGYQQTYGREPLDFSANISPLGVPDGVRRAVEASASRIDRYPDPLCRALSQAIAEREGVPVDRILCGGGAADLIFRAALSISPRNALVTAPTFSEYRAALTACGCGVQEYRLRPEQDFGVDEGILVSITEDVDLMFLCEPNNPSGVTTPRPLLEKILQRCRKTGTVLIVDECFADMLDDPEAHTMKDMMEDFPNLIILKAFTKLYGMAGVRLGYAMSSNPVLLAQMRQAGQSWSVSLPAQMAGLAALRADDYAERVRVLIREQRPRLAAGLAELGLRVIPGEANYLLFQSPRILTDALADRGILIRDCRSFSGLDESWYRVAVRTGEENGRLLAALKEVLA